MKGQDDPLLPFDSDNVTCSLTCSFGEPWMGAHPKCQAYSDVLHQQFEDAVARGEFDAEGYSPGDRRAQKRSGRHEEITT